MSVTTRFEPPKDGLVRAMQPGLEVRAASDGGMPTLHGYLLRFDEWTEIDSLFEGWFMERIAPGAATKTLKESRDSIKVLFNHGSDPTTGEKPLARPTFTEDERGVRYEGELFDTQYCRELVPGLEAGQYGASFKFRVVKETVDQEPEASSYNPKAIPERTVEEIKLYEGGPVVFPAYAGATAGVRSLTDRFRSYSGEELESIFPRWVARDPERVRQLLVESEERAVISYKKTPTSTEAWDAGANEKQLPSPMPVGKMREAYAWMDTLMMDEGMCPKSAGKFIHHEVAEDGSVGAANLAACSAGIGVLNGGRGGADIPDADRQGVYDHLAHHLKDAGKEPPALKGRSELDEEPATEPLPDDEETTDDGRSDALSGAETSHSAGSRTAPLGGAVAARRTPPWRQKSERVPPWHSEKKGSEK